MRCIKALGLCLAAALLPAGIILPANAGAVAFIVKKQGNELIVGRNVGSQAFIIPGEGAVECVEATGMGLAEAKFGKPFEFQLITIVYKGCTFLGLPVTVSPAMLDFRANGEVRIVEKEEEKQPAKPILIEIAGCEVTIGEAGNTTLKTVEYKNLTKGEVEVFAKLTGITATESIGCPTPGVTKAAEYRGRSIVREEGGEIEVK